MASNRKNTFSPVFARLDVGKYTTQDDNSDLNNSDVWLAEMDLSLVDHKQTENFDPPSGSKNDCNNDCISSRNQSSDFGNNEDLLEFSGDADLFDYPLREEFLPHNVLCMKSPDFSKADVDQSLIRDSYQQELVKNFESDSNASGTNHKPKLEEHLFSNSTMCDHNLDRQRLKRVHSHTFPDSETQQTRPKQSLQTPKTIGPRSRGSILKDRLKSRFLQNASNVTPVSNNLEEVSKENITRAMIEASQIRREGITGSVGPFYGLPSKVPEMLSANRKINKLYDWQHECLTLPAVHEGRNLIYTLPTSGGKTLVAEILILQQLLCKKKDALLVLPYISIVQEKVRILSEFAAELGFLVEEYAGSKGRFPPTKRRKKHSLFVATIEKGQSLVNSLVEADRLEELGLVVVDELHMIGEGGSRGSAMESTLLKVLNAVTEPPQIIGMSATLSNIADLATFLNAELFNNDFRPVTLTEFVKVEDNLYQVNNEALVPEEKLQHNKLLTFPQNEESQTKDPDHLLHLVLEIVPDNSCLLFCPTKRYCENVILMLAKMMCKKHRHLKDVQKEKRKALLRDLHTDGGGKLCNILEYTVHFGLAYHHSGLTTDERRLIEDAYSDGVLCLLTCTSTLAAGVNLPAKRVILRSPYVGADFIKHSQYKQMTGRAGRAGIDSSGESILITKKQDMPKVVDLLSGPQDFCHSSLMFQSGKGLRTLILSLIGLKVVNTTDAVYTVVGKSLLAVQAVHLGVDIVTAIQQSLQELLDQSLVVQKKAACDSSHQQLDIKDLAVSDKLEAYSLEVTDLGKAIFKGSVDIGHGSRLYNDLMQSKQCLVLANHLHLLYLVTPYDLAQDISPSWMTYMQEMGVLAEIELKVAGLIGVDESFVVRKASGQSIRQRVDNLVVQRFYLTLMLYELWKEQTVWDVAEKFQMPRGFIQNLLSSAASFASCVLRFCQELPEFWAYQDLLGNFGQRLTHCVSMELMPLMEVPGVKLARARQLFSAGYKTLQSLAAATPSDLVNKIEFLTHKAAKQIVSAAMVVLEEKTEALLDQVEQLVPLPQSSV